MIWINRHDHLSVTAFTIHHGGIITWFKWINGMGCKETALFDSILTPTDLIAKTKQKTKKRETKLFLIPLASCLVLTFGSHGQRAVFRYRRQQPGVVGEVVVGLPADVSKFGIVGRRAGNKVAPDLERRWQHAVYYKFLFHELVSVFIWMTEPLCLNN